MTFKTITGAQFARTYTSRPAQFAWFLGAGASASAGVPTGYAMIRDFKAQLFCQAAGLPRREVDSADPLWEIRIDEFSSKRAILPPAGDPSEYSAAFEAVYPDEAERRRYIEEAARKGIPSFAHRVLASLISTKRIPCLFTTNFDPLVERATVVTDSMLPAEQQAHLTTAALDSYERAERCLRESSWPLLAKLHGDYQSTRLKNSAAELISQDACMRKVLSGACQRFGLVVVGYSGRDASIMEALTRSLQASQAFPAGLYWVTKSPEDLRPAVKEFLAAASDAGVTGAIVEAQNFDELAGDILDLVTLPAELTPHLNESHPAPIVRPVPLPAKEAAYFPILLCSALPIMQMPKAARRLRLASPATTAQVRDLLRTANVRAVAACTGREVAVFGPDEGILGALESLGAETAGTVELDPEAGGWALGLLYDGIIRAICKDRPLFARMRHSGHLVLIARGSANEDQELARRRSERLSRLKQAYSSALFGIVPKLGFPFTEGLQIRLEQCAQRWWCVFDPVTYIETPKPDPAESREDDTTTELAPPVFHRGDPAGDWRRERWAQRYNGTWAKILEAWSDLLTGTDDGLLRAFNLSEGSGLDAIFELSRITAWGRPSHQHRYFLR